MLSSLTGENGFTPYDIFNVQKGDFVALAGDIFRYQYQNNAFYKKYCDFRGGFAAPVGIATNLVNDGRGGNRSEGVVGDNTNKGDNDGRGENRSEGVVGDNTNKGDFAGKVVPVGVVTKRAKDGVGEKENEGENLIFQISYSKSQIPFLPISFFKTHRIASFTGEVEKVFTSSGTTGAQTSRHFVPDLLLYEESFTRGFRHFYGDPAQFAFLCLLPSYLEREGSSLIYMAKRLIELSGQADSGFFLQAGGKLIETLARREKEGLKTILLGVSFALLDFAEQFPMPLRHTFVMETGGMKGRRRELTRAELHDKLQKAFGVPSIHSEYGMTELMSQAYSKGEGRYQCPPWMRVYVRDEDDPFSVNISGSGLLCIADLANLYSCSFIETSDAGRVYEDGSFEVLGRMDNSDIRGCSLLVV